MLKMYYKGVIRTDMSIKKAVHFIERPWVRQGMAGMVSFYFFR